MDESLEKFQWMILKLLVSGGTLEGLSQIISGQRLELEAWHELRELLNC